MTSAQDPVDSGRHRLGPHVIGKRVVVRRVLRGRTGPSGGPALTDLLGTCLSWGEGVCVLQPAEGEPVTIAIADIVTGKPVPPRQSVRQRVPVRDTELHTTSLFPSVSVQPVGEWTLRWEPAPEGRLRKRANSCLAMGDPGLPLADALATVASHYAGLGRDPLVQVEAGADLDGAISALGWTPVAGGDSDFLVTSSALLSRRLRGIEGLVALTSDGDQALATIGDGGAEWARGRAAIDGDWLGVHDVYVDPHHRRQGLAKQLMAELLDWGAEQGVMTVWLHVETDNAPALALYDDLGFIRHHGCRYLATAVG